MEKEALSKLKLDELRKIGKNLNITNLVKYRKAELVEKITSVQSLLETAQKQEDALREAKRLAESGASAPRPQIEEQESEGLSARRG